MSAEPPDLPPETPAPPQTPRRGPEAGMERLRLLLAYDGRGFRGWQSQPGGEGVQDHLEAAFARITGRKTSVQGSGRTDTGVHALGQSAHVDVPAGLLASRQWQSALNANLAAGVRVLRASWTRPHFHARFDAEGKVYLYRIWNETFQHPLEAGRAWHMPSQLDLSRLRAAADLVVGRHDFARFAANRGHAVLDTVRTIQSIGLTRRGPLLTLRFQGNGFLYHMVRLLVGSIVRCAQQRAELAWIADLLANEKAAKTHFLAPAEGLYLARVLY